MIDTCYTQLNHVNYEITGQKPTNFITDVDRSLPLLMRQSAVQSSNAFLNASQTNEDKQSDLRPVYRVQRSTNESRNLRSY